MRFITIALAATLAYVWAQEIKMPLNLDKLEQKAKESVTVTLDKPMLQFASKFMKDEDDAEVRKLISGLESIYVRSFEFDKDGEYDPADLESIRSQLQPPAWGRIVGVRSKRDGENVDVYFKDAGNGQLGGIVVLAAEPRELSIVQLTGTFDPARLADLGGDFGIPRLDTSGLERRRR